MRILFLITNDDSGKLLSRFLTRAGHEVRLVNAVNDVRGRLLDERFDLLVFGGVVARDGNVWDYMPDLKREFGVSAIVLSGYGLPCEIERSLAAGFSEHLLKPVMPERLLAAVERATRTAS